MFKYQKQANVKLEFGSPSTKRRKFTWPEGLLLKQSCTVFYVILISSLGKQNLLSSKNLPSAFQMPSLTLMKRQEQQNVYSASAEMIPHCQTYAILMSL